MPKLQGFPWHVTYGSNVTKAKVNRRIVSKCERYQPGHKCLNRKTGQISKCKGLKKCNSYREKIVVKGEPVHYISTGKKTYFASGKGAMMIKIGSLIKHSTGKVGTVKSITKSKVHIELADKTIHQCSRLNMRKWEVLKK